MSILGQNLKAQNVCPDCGAGIFGVRAKKRCSPCSDIMRQARERGYDAKRRGLEFDVEAYAAKLRKEFNYG